MIIREEDMKMLAETLQKQLAIGNQWMTYENGIFTSRLDDMQFFKTEEEAQQHCIKLNDTGLLDYSWISIDPLYQVIQQKVVEDKTRTDVEFYYVNDLRFDVTRTLKSDTDPQIFYDPDKDEFSAKIREEASVNKEVVKQTNTSDTNQNYSYEHPPLPYENIKQLVDKLEGLQYPYHFGLATVDPINKGLPNFEVRYQDWDCSEKIDYVLFFSRHENGFYDLDKVNATYFPAIKIDHLLINGIDTRKLDFIMGTMDWNFEKIRWGKEVEDALKLISRDEDGKIIAVALWNNNAPQFTKKADFIEQLENELGTFISRGFPGNIDFEEIYSELIERHWISEKLSNLPIDAVHNPNAKLAMIEQLANREVLCLHLPIGQTERTELFFKWDMTSGEIKVHDEAGNLYRVGKENYFEKTKVGIERSEEEKMLLKQLEGYLIRELNSQDCQDLLINNLLEGELCSIHLERMITPGLRIEKYMVIEFNYLKRHHILGSYSEFEKAVHSMYRNGSDFINDLTKSESKLMLIGQYYNQKLQFNLVGEPEPSTGYLLAAANSFSDAGYNFVFKGDATKMQQITDELYVSTGSSTHQLRFYDLNGKSREVDFNFWGHAVNKEQIKSEPQKDVVLLQKHRHDNGNGIKR